VRISAQLISFGTGSLESFGCFDATENKIIMGSDYAPTFIHELVHAIDFIIPDYYYEEDYTELVAEFATLVICKTYGIQINTSYSLYYLNIHTNSKSGEKIGDVIKRVSLICEYIKNCLKHTRLPAV
jgi:hypothetical protein